MKLRRDRMMQAGVGYVITVVLLFAAGIIYKKKQDRAATEELGASYVVQAISLEQTVYAYIHPDRGYAKDLAILGAECTSTPALPCPQSATQSALYGPSCTAETWCTWSGWKFTIAATGASPVTDFVIAATPAAPKGGKNSLCSTSDNVPRKHAGPIMKPPTVRECLTWTPIQLPKFPIRSVRR